MHPTLHDGDCASNEPHQLQETPAMKGQGGLYALLMPSLLVSSVSNGMLHSCSLWQLEGDGGSAATKRRANCADAVTCTAVGIAACYVDIDGHMDLWFSRGMASGAEDLPFVSASCEALLRTEYTLRIEYMLRTADLQRRCEWRRLDPSSVDVAGPRRVPIVRPHAPPPHQAT